MNIPLWVLALLVIPTLAGFAGLIATAKGLNKPPEQRKRLFITGVALTVFAAAMFLVILGIVA